MTYKDMLMSYKLPTSFVVFEETNIKLVNSFMERHPYRYEQELFYHLMKLFGVDKKDAKVPNFRKYLSKKRLSIYNDEYPDVSRNELDLVVNSTIEFIAIILGLKKSTVEKYNNRHAISYVWYLRKV